MSWKAWTDRIEAECQNCAAGGIYSLDGSPWAEFGNTEQYKLNPADITAAKDCIQSKLPSKSPVHVGGCKQIITSAGDGFIIGKHQNKSCIVAIECKMCIIVVVGGEGTEPRQYMDKLYKVAELLKDAGY